MTARGYDLVKRAIDLVAASIVLLVSLPFQAVIALLVRRSLGSPVLFRQERPGRDGEVFTIVKFRTMKPSDSDQATDEARLTPLGRRLRSTSLDELPSLVNVIRGDMSLVGPRPLLVEYLDRYTPDQARRHEVRPGITGLAQVSGRNAISWEDKLRLDVEYVDQRSLGLDLAIMARTVVSVLRRHGISHPGTATTTHFRGSRAE